MKKFKKLVSLLLVAVMLVSSAVLFAFAKSEPFKTTIPTVYVVGQGTNLYYDDENGKTTKFYPFVIEDGYIGDYGKKLIAPLFSSIFTGNWDEYSSILTEAITGVVSSVGLDENGNAYPGQRGWSLSSTLVNYSGGYPLFGRDTSGTPGYHFNYDWRLDPLETAHRLNDYIAQVKKVTKAEKVNLVGRCLGANIVLSYLYLYGSDDIEKTVLYSAGLENFTSVGTLFSGKITFDAQGLSAWVNNYISESDYAGEPIVQTLGLFAELLSYANLLGVPMELVEAFWKNVYDKVLPEVLLSSYASMPSFWAFVGDEYFEDAKEFIFSGKEEQYAVLIEKIDNYHNTVGQSTEKIIDDANAAGNTVSIIAKYGLQMIPVVEDANVMADGYLETSSASMGATCSTINGKLSADYIAQKVESGEDKYISADKQVDASTARYRDRTWFIKNLPHMSAPACVNQLIAAILNFDGDMTVFDDENLPQFMEYTSNSKGESIAPLAAKGGPSSLGKAVGGKYSALIDMLVKLIEILLNALSKLAG